MRRNLILGGISLLALPMAGTAQATTADDVAAANAAFDAALSRRDLAAVEALYLQDDEVTAAHPRDREPVQGWAAVRKTWVDTFARFSQLSVVMPKPTIRVMGDTAVVVGLENVRARRAADEAAVAFDAMTTNVFQRQGGKWLMVHHHATMMPG